jgi:hypothetical protein
MELSGNSDRRPYRRVRGGYISRRRAQTTDACAASWLGTYN